MIWKDCELQQLDGQGKDALGNLTGGVWNTIKKTKARLTPWTDEQIGLEGREVTRNEQRYALRIPFRLYPKDATHALIDGIRQEIRQCFDLSPRYTVIQVRAYRE